MKRADLDILLQAGEGAKAQGYPAPEFSVGGFFSAVFWPIRNAAAATPQVTPETGSY